MSTVELGAREPDLLRFWDEPLLPEERLLCTELLSLKRELVLRLLLLGSFLIYTFVKLETN